MEASIMYKINLKSSSALAIISILLASLMVFSFGCVKKEEKEIKIGAILPMTGDAAKYGIWAKNGMDMAVEEINRAGGINGKKLKLEIQDSKTSPTEAVNAMHFLLTTSRPIAVFTTLTSVSKALIPITEKEKIILFANSTLPGITESGKYVFRNVANLAGDIPVAIDYCVEKMGKKPVGIIWRNDDFGVWGSTKFKELYESKGGQVTASESFEPKTDDFKTPIVKIAKGKPAIVYVLAYSEAGMIIKQARELGHKWQFVGITTLGDPEVSRIAGSTLNGAIFTESAFDPKSDNERIKAYQVEYQRRYGERSEVWAATFYDAVKIFAMAAQKTGNDADKLREALINVKDFPGISGNTTFLPNGDVIKPVNLKTIKNGKPEPIEIK
jgi:branched-chain amino acid transport system substrate-binding protein